MVATATVEFNDITDVPLRGVSPTLNALNLCLIRRDDPDAPLQGLWLALVRLDPAQALTLERGTLYANIVARADSGPLSRSTLMLSTPSPGHSPTLARLLTSRNYQELLQDGGPSDFSMDNVEGAFPTGLDLTTQLPTDNTTHELNFADGSPVWRYWGSLFGQDFSAEFTVEFAWQR